MKKFAILLFVLLPLLNSCSSDDSGVSEPELTTNGTILKRVVLTNGSNIVTTDYFYNGNKIERIVGSNGIRLEYTYTGELITKLESYLNNVLKSTENYDYNLNGKITQIIGLEYANNYGIRHQFIYNIDGTINLTLFSGNLITQNTQSASKKVFLFPNGDVEKIEDYVIVNGNNVTKTNYYTYDDKNAPANYILGYNKIKHWEYGTYNNSHNNTSVTYTSTEPSFVSYTNNNGMLTYNSFNYPITQDIVSSHYQYFYQQN